MTRYRVSLQGWISRLVDWLSKAKISLKDLGHFTHQSGLYMPKPFCMANLNRGELCTDEQRTALATQIGHRNFRTVRPRHTRFFGARNHGDPKQTLAVAYCAFETTSAGRVAVSIDLYKEMERG